MDQLLYVNLYNHKDLNFMQIRSGRISDETVKLGSANTVQDSVLDVAYLLFSETHFADADDEFVWHTADGLETAEQSRSIAQTAVRLSNERGVRDEREAVPLTFFIPTKSTSYARKA